MNRSHRTSTRAQQTLGLMRHTDPQQTVLETATTEAMRPPALKEQVSRL